METASSDKNFNNAEAERDFCGKIVRMSGDDFRRCLQCQCCGSGCPVVDAMKYRPNGIIRLVQLGFGREALESSDIWLCMGCNTCSTECPMAIDIAAVMSALREEAIEEGVKIAEPGILNFHKEVINSIERYGRTHKLEIMMRHKLKRFEFFSDIDIGLKLLSRRKLDLTPSKISDAEDVRKLFSDLPGEKE
jgi:heterodisulfide reductase subunit C